MGGVGYVGVGYVGHVSRQVGGGRDVGVVLMRGGLAGHRALKGRAC